MNLPPDVREALDRFDDDEAPGENVDNDDDGRILIDYLASLVAEPADSPDLATFIAHIEAAACDTEELDMAVHEIKAGEAASINNSGVAAQVRYLVADGVTIDHLRTLLTLAP